MVLAAIFNPSAVEASGILEAPVVIEEKIDYVAGNCWLYLKSKIPSWPNTKDLIPNSVHPVVGGAIILQYKVPHYVLVEKVIEEGVWISESNFGGPGYSKRLLSWEYLKDHSAKYWYVPDSG
jgi:hypothetical protein